MSTIRSNVDLGKLQIDELNAISEAIEQDTVVTEEVATTAKNSITLTLIAVIAFLLLLVINFSIDIFQTYTSIAITSHVMAILYLGVYSLALGALLFYILFTIKYYITLKDAFGIQVETSQSDDYEEQRIVALKILSHYMSHHDALVRNNARSLYKAIEKNSVHDPYLQIKTDIIDELDKQATVVVYQSAKEVSLFTAFSPGSALDSIVVIFTSAKLMKKIFYTYGYRTNLLTSLLIIRKILENASLAALIEYADDSVSDVLGNALLSTISVKVAQGIGNGVLMLRIGNILIQSARPFASDGSIGTYKQMAKIFLEYIKGRIR